MVVEYDCGRTDRRSQKKNPAVATAAVTWTASRACSTPLSRCRNQRTTHRTFPRHPLRRPALWPFLPACPRSRNRLHAESKLLVHTEEHETTPTNRSVRTRPKARSQDPTKGESKRQRKGGRTDEEGRKDRRRSRLKVQAKERKGS